MYRVEDKYQCSPQELFELESKLKIIMRSDRHAQDHTGYTVTSVYFDDYWDTCLNECKNEVRQRQKYRIRIYDGSFDIIKLEIKQKLDNRIYKKGQTITYHQMQTLLSGKAIEGAGIGEDAITQFNLAIKNTGLKPKILVEYDRQAFISQPGNVRITLDRDLRFSMNIEAIYHSQNRSRLMSEQNDVLEVKYDSMLPGFIARVLESGNMNQVSFSKYQLCRDAWEDRQNVY